MKVKLCLSLIVIVVLLPIISSNAQPANPAYPRDTLFENEIIGRLAKIDTTAARLFTEATKDSDEERLKEAKEKFDAVLQLAPGFIDAERRLSYVELNLGNFTAAIDLAQKAYTADSTRWNKLALASAYLSTGDSLRIEEAFILANSVCAEFPNDSSAQLIAFHAKVAVNDWDYIVENSQHITEIFPQFSFGHYAYAAVLADKKAWRSAERELKIAQSLGMTTLQMDPLMLDEIQRNARIDTWKIRGGLAIAAWALGLGILFLLGMILSKMTLKAVGKIQKMGTFEVSKSENIIRNIYRWVITITSAYFYISIPVLIILVVVLAGGSLYMIFEIGRIPIQLVIFIVTAAVMTLYAILRSIVARAGNEDPGRPLSREEAPELWKVTDDVATKVQTRPIEAIFITPGTEIAVMEKGKALQKLRGEGKRCLILGMAAITDMKIDPFKSILAHEYGHFSNRDTAGGNLANKTNRSMYDMAFTLIKNGVAKWYNPAWWFLSSYRAVFLRATLGASRLQEILADRIASIAYGAGNFITGLTHVIRKGAYFDEQLNSTFKKDANEFLKLNNLYSLPPIESDLVREGLEEHIAAIMNRTSSEYDSHPAPNERFALLEKILTPSREMSVEGEVFQLIPGATNLQEEMTKVIQDNIKNRFRELAEAS